MSNDKQQFIARLILDGTALCLIAMAIFTFLSLATYNYQDPSFNTAQQAGADIKNWMGSTGAHISDFLLQTVGIVSFLIVPITAIWGYQIFIRKNISFKTMRIACLFLGLLTLSIPFAAISYDGGWLIQNNLGGAAGTILLNTLNNAFSQITANYYLALTLGTTIIAGMALTVFATSADKSQWSRVKDYLVFGIRYVANMVQSFGYWLKIHGKRPEKVRIEPKPKPTANAPQDVTTPPKEKSKPVIEAQPKTITTPKKEAKLFATAKGDTDWLLPSLDILQNVPAGEHNDVDERALQNNADLLQQILEDFKVEGEIVKVHPGPVVTLYELEPAPGVKSSRVISLSDDIARSMAAVSVRAAVMPGQNVIGIELPNKDRKTVYLREVLESDPYTKTKAKLPLALGKDISGHEIIADLSKMPHLLIAGTTGSGKSVGINTMILSLIYNLSPEQCRLIMIDPKMLELSVYDDIPHLLAPVVTEPGRAIMTLKWLVSEMENRYRAMSKLGVRNIDGYNQRMKDAIKNGDVLSRKVQTGFDPETGKPVFEDQPMDMSELPYIVVIVDEFADLMLVAGKEVEAAIQRLAQMARAAGIHIIMATQRPSVDVITGVIKANFPTRISFAVTSKIDSRTILGEGGAEQLLGMGDMLYMAAGGRIQRVHGPFVSDDEVEEVVKHLKEQAEPDYIDIFTDAGGGETLEDLYGDSSGGSSDVDELYDEAVALIAREGKASTSFIQRCLQIGYNRAARIIEEMERQGVVSKASPTGKRDILISDHSSNQGGGRDTGT